MASGVSLNQTIKALGEIQKSNMWEMTIIPNSDIGVSISSSLKFRVVGFDMPTQEVAMIEETLNNFPIGQPSVIKRKGSTTITFLESTDGDAFDTMQGLSEAIFGMTETDATGISKGWKSLKGEVIMWLKDSQGNKTRGAKLIDCTFKPKIFSGISAETGDGSSVKPTMEIDYNWWNYLKA